MTILVVTDCPKKIRGHLSKWLLEVNTNVFVGHLNKRVREALWELVCENITKGKATMIFNRQGEQGIGIYTHGNSWEPVDFEGIYLIRKPLPEKQPSFRSEYVSKERLFHTVKTHKKVAEQILSKVYVALDLETTGLTNKDEIIEIGAIRFDKHTILDSFHVYVHTEKEITRDVTQLTGITNQIINTMGISIDEALEQLFDFIGSDELVLHNAQFDMNFIRIACIKNNKPMIKNRFQDTLVIARKKIIKLKKFSLENLGKYFNIECSHLHNAIDDCELTRQVFLKLLDFNELE